jgi:large subunit ribosomal protein L9
MRQQLLLLEDVESLGKKGEIVTAKPGYVRNYLLPKGYAMVATSNTLRKQERLRAEREKQAIIDRKESEELAAKIEGISIETYVKVDPEGHMYGSVAASDIAALFQEQGFAVDKKAVQVTKPIKVTGSHKITIKLKEGVTASCNLLIIPEGGKASDLQTAQAPVVSQEEKVEEKPE